MAAYPLDVDEFALLGDEARDFSIALAAAPVTRRTSIRTDDGEVSAIAWGSSPPEAVLLHGVGLNAHTWDATLLALGRPAIALDLPGHGRSSWRDDGRYVPELLGPSLAQAIESAAPDATVIVGQSLGGLATLALCEQRPDLVRRAVLVDALPSGAGPAAAARVADFLEGPASFATREEIVARARSFGLGRSWASVERAVAHNTCRRPDGRYVWRHHVGQRPREVHWLADSSTLWPALATAAVPVTLVRAARGFLSEDQLATLAERAPHVRVVALETGHNVQEEDPVGLARLLEADLAR